MERFQAYEDLEEPCFLSLRAEHILVTYQMKSILTTHPWTMIKHLKVVRPRPDAVNTNTKVVKVPKIDMKHNQLKIRFLDGHQQLYRFDSKVMLEAFINAAVDGAHLKPITSSNFLWLAKVKYVPATCANGNHPPNEGEEEKSNASDEKAQPSPASITT